MNLELHIIGSREGYEKYPHDGFDDELKQCSTLLQGTETLVISRVPEVIHYVYLHHIGPKGSKEFFGLSLSFNGVYFRSAKTAFEVMERLFETAVYGGLVVHVADTGQMEFNQPSFYDQAPHYNQLEKEAQRIIDSLPRNTLLALPRSFRIGQGSATVNLDEGEEVVADHVAQHDRVAVIRSSTHVGLNDIQERLSRLHEQNVEWEKKFNEEQKKKKQYSLVVILLLVLLVGGAVAAYVIRGNFFTIGSLKENVTQLNDELAQNKQTIHQHQKHIAELQDTARRQMNKIEQLTDSLQQMAYSLSQYAAIQYTVGMPTIENNSFDEGYSMWLYAEVPIIIESIALRGKSSGYANIVLRDSEGYYVASETVSVNTSFSQRIVDLKIPSSGYYSLNVETSGMRLQYNSVDSETYRTMGSGPLRIKGCCGRSKSHNSAQMNFYQYFYNIKYHVSL